MPVLLEHLADHVLTLTLNRPERGNALSAELVDALYQAIERAELGAEARVVVLRGAGEEFCAGADPDELAAAATAERTLEDNEAAARRLGLLFQRLRTLPKPVVAVVHGHALGGGAALATACDIAVAAETAELGYPEIRRGLVPAMAMPLLRRLVGEKLALDLVLTGRTLSAPAGVAAGLLTRAVPDADLEREAAALIRTLAESNATALALAKQLFYQLDGLPLTDGIALAARIEGLRQSVRFLRQ